MEADLGRCFAESILKQKGKGQKWLPELLKAGLIRPRQAQAEVQPKPKSVQFDLPRNTPSASELCK